MYGFLFQVGKFYELYHMDAAIGVQELGLMYMKVRMYSMWNVCMYVCTSTQTIIVVVMYACM